MRIVRPDQAHAAAPYVTLCLSAICRRHMGPAEGASMAGPSASQSQPDLNAIKGRAPVLHSATAGPV